MEPQFVNKVLELNKSKQTLIILILNSEKNKNKKNSIYSKC